MDKKKLIIFDFDGTLVNIEPVFFKIFNSLAPEFGYTPLLQNELLDLKKLHLRRFIWKRLGLRILFFPQILRRGREEYRKLVSEVEMFPEMKELLNTLRSHDYGIGIVSSSQKETIVALLKKFNIEMDFVYQCGLFSKSKVLTRVPQERNTLISETLYVGDEVRDVEACQKIGLDIIAVSWGLNSRAALEKTLTPIIVNNPKELLEAILRVS